MNSPLSFHEPGPWRRNETLGGRGRRWVGKTLWRARNLLEHAGPPADLLSSGLIRAELHQSGRRGEPEAGRHGTRRHLVREFQERDHRTCGSSRGAASEKNCPLKDGLGSLGPRRPGSLWPSGRWTARILRSRDAPVARRLLHSQPRRVGDPRHQGCLSALGTGAVQGPNRPGPHRFPPRENLC